MAKTVKTNIGEIPVRDYLEIVANQNGFDSYKDMKDYGLSVNLPEGVEEDMNLDDMEER